MLIKKLSRQGNSSALIIDRTLLELMEIDADTPLKLRVKGRRLIVEPLGVKDKKPKTKAEGKKAG